jgi:hypothetical protein
MIIHIVSSLYIYWRYSLSSPVKQRSPRTLIHSGVVINSFNPPLLHLTLNTHTVQANTLSIIDNDILLTHLTSLSLILSTRMMLSDGFHHLDIVTIDQVQNIEFYQEIDIFIGIQSLLVTVLDQQYKSVRNISVRLELVDYSHISLEHQTNRFGQVVFRHLPRQARVYIEAVCLNSQRHASVELDTFHYRNVTLILQEMSSLDYDEYDPSDRGYYAV